MNDSGAADWLIAHRGYPEAFPENSLIGVEAALAAGARFVEFDVQFTRDEVPVVFHDDSLRRVGDRDEPIAALDWATVSKCTIGEPDRFGPRFAQQRVPSLSDMLDLVDRYPGVTAFVEIKSDSLARLGRRAVAGAVHDRLRSAASRCVPISFDAGVLAAVRECGAGEIGLVLGSWSEVSRREAGRLAPDHLFVQAGRVPDGDQPFWPGPWRWTVYVVDDADEALAFRECGAQLVETDRFVPMLEALR